MMELSHSLTLNEDALNQIPEAKRPVFVFEWLRFLEKVLIAAQKVIDIWNVKTWLLNWPFTFNAQHVYHLWLCAGFITSYNSIQYFFLPEWHKGMSAKTGGAIDQAHARCTWATNASIDSKMFGHPVQRWRHIFTLRYRQQMQRYPQEQRWLAQFSANEIVSDFSYCSKAQGFILEQRLNWIYF